MSCRPSLNDLPAEVICYIFTFLDLKELKNFKFLNKRLNILSQDDKHWKRFCKKYWLETTCPIGRTWEEHFVHWHRDFGAYISCYAQVKTCWEKIKTYLKTNCPLIHDTIKEGASEDELNLLEERLGLTLPLDFRCSYRIHNGQKLTSPGLLGSLSLPGHYRSESLLDLSTVLVGFRPRDGLRGCIPLTLCLHSGLTQYLAVTDEDGYEPNTIFYTASSEPLPGQQKLMDAFISGTSFLNWLTTLANHYANDEYVLMQDQPFRFLHDPSAEEVTGNIKVSVATCFLPEISKINPPKFYHTYRITMSMDPEARQSDSCQLETRHWLITDDNDTEQQVDGPGVVGEYPVMYPGAVFNWVSSTTFGTTYGNMRGYFSMRNLDSNERHEVNCPLFHMKCLPYITGAEREATKLRKRNEETTHASHLPTHSFS